MKVYTPITPGQALDALLAGNTCVYGRLSSAAPWCPARIWAGGIVYLVTRTGHDVSVSGLLVEWALVRDVHEESMRVKCTQLGPDGPLYLHPLPDWVRADVEYDVTIREVVG